MTSVPTPTKDLRKWAAETDLHVLIEAERIMRDKTRHGSAMALHKVKHAELAAVAGRNFGQPEAIVGHEVESTDKFGT